MIQTALKWIGNEQDTKKQVYSKILILFIILTMACFSQNLIPVHIAFIPILIPALLKVLTELKVSQTCHMYYYIWIDYSYMWILQDSEKFIMTYYKPTYLRKAALHLMSHLFQKQ